jgi:hypothetical protein
LDKTTPIVVLATYDTRVGHSSENAKTGDMIQIWILRDDMPPSDALKLGLDGPICGKCPHMSKAAGGSGACYVNVAYRGPQATWKAYNRDGTRLTKSGQPTSVADSLPFDVEAFRGRKVRFGAYGDPAAAPFRVWRSIALVAAAVTGYTHQWRTADSRFTRHLMASCDHPDEYEEAVAKGWRTFTVRPAGTPKPHGMVQCPAAAEAGKRTTCADCLQCGGTIGGRTASISIEAHGTSKNKFRASLPLMVV